MIKPFKLKKGDTVGVIAPAGPPKQETLQRGLAILEGKGLNIKMGNYVFHGKGYLSGTDEERLHDLHAMFRDKEVKAIICACGGYGSARITQYMDFELIKNNPKIFWGYSDITFLHTAIRQRTGLVTFHGPMIASDMGKPEWDALSEKYLDQLFKTDDIIYTEEIAPIQTPIEGKARGELVGGNLCLLTTTLGTSFEIETDGKILFIEDTNEEPNKVDRMLKHLYLAGKFDNLAGLAVGDFNNCEPKDHDKPSFSLDEVLSHYIKKAGVPTLQGLKMGHCTPHISVPLGTEAEMDTGKKRLTVKSGLQE